MNIFEEALSFLYKNAIDPLSDSIIEVKKANAEVELHRLIDCQLTPEEIDFILWDDERKMSEAEQKAFVEGIIAKLRRQKEIMSDDQNK